MRVIDAYEPDRHQDVLMVSSVDLPVLHHGFVPASDVQQRPYSSSLPYRAGGRKFLIGVVPDPTSPRPAGSFDRLARAAAGGRLRFGLAITPVNGRFKRIGTLDLRELLPDALDALRFSPFNCGGGLQPVGLLNRLRDYAYPAVPGGEGPSRRPSSQAGRGGCHAATDRAPADVGGVKTQRPCVGHNGRFYTVSKPRFGLTDSWSGCT